MIDDLFYIVAVDSEKAAIKSTLQPDKVMFAPRSDLYKMSAETFIGGAIAGGFYSCLFSKKLERFYPEYYFVSAKKLYHLTQDKHYEEMHARIALPICSIFASQSKVIVANENNAFITDLDCNRLGFTGMTFSAIAWDHKLFLHEQSFKVFGSGLYFVNNIVTAVRADLSLQYVYQTNLSDAVFFEKKYNLKAQSANVAIEPADLERLARLQLFELHKTENGLYLDDICIMSRKESK